MQLVENLSSVGLEQAVSILEEEIVLGFLHPRERLVEDELLERFGLKRHVVRQVLVELERMGLVERKRNIGALVKAYTAKEVEDLYAVRELLECQCVRLIRFPLPQSALDALTATQKLHDETVQSGNLRGAFRANMRFHELLFGLSDNPVLVAAIRDHAQRAHSVRSSSLVVADQLERARREHWSIIEALRDQDVEKLVQLCSDHLKPSRDNYIAACHRRTGQ
ncbi:DNA-binding GntR family transcriptional regulator [Pseudomonas sp. JUb42]|jgi:DNA-binding GntR family transcriptional regulator|uniref:GntR family transcriptional regulator n=1 Tax=Pseudomonas sp. JUb42 TaxID=2940611 RepID=UPI00216990D4|nr:GntR family transcriptional regulator [Pseudomonas sp. JUb42]MCS3471471.1 DNA-binding GntR family transcriptional regulator [Pseudomonas sp. JUb42]